MNFAYPHILYLLMMCNPSGEEAVIRMEDLMTVSAETPKALESAVEPGTKLFEIGAADYADGSCRLGEQSFVIWQIKNTSV